MIVFSYGEVGMEHGFGPRGMDRRRGYILAMEAA